ncbi:hypothetical protein O1611_g8100 [Lasiodiplodia mahajangana]|uniref:Uncharacterized protein n=1 Tax=Lasiodiplodia mahajangana TaxID=1108764 RepID=A0ACC2JDJ2_9PEZI|nr:hypothetical protein O1611_g8100 [Lasiodiplodia mahajangana]
MTTYAATCHACGEHGESTVTLTVPAAVVARTGEAHVVAVAVQTVVPVLEHGAATGNSSFAHPSPPANYPVAGAGNATVSRTAGFFQTLGYGVALWFIIFGIGMIL